MPIPNIRTPVLAGSPATFEAYWQKFLGELTRQVDRVEALVSRFGLLADLPSSLGVRDAGRIYQTTDTYQVFRWSGAAWVEATPGNVSQVAYASGTQALTTAYADIAGCTLTLSRPGRYAITGFVDFSGAGILDAGALGVAQLVTDGSSPAAHLAVSLVSSTVAGDAICTRATVGQQWLYTAAAAGKVVKLQAKKTAGTGTSSLGVHCSISAIWLGP